MKSGVPWSVKGLRPEAREAAREAAQRSGMPLGEWLNSVIINQAVHEGVDPHADDDGDDISAVHARLDELTQRLDRMTRTGPAAYAPARVRHAMAPVEQQQYAAPRPALTLGGIDQAVAEISARRAALNGEPSPMPAQARAVVAAPVRVPLPSQDLSGLEDQLRQITSQIETLRQPGVEEAINALRNELGEIVNAVTEAMPQRAIDLIEKQIHGLSQRISEGRQAGVDGAALSGIEQGLAEVRDAVRGLTPAEGLIGFSDAVSDLARKIDLIVAEKDPATIQQLESAITTLRGLSGHIADNESIGQLAAQVQALTEKVDRLAVSGHASDALNHLEQRITALSDAIEQRAQSGGSVPPRLEALVNSLADKIELIQMSRGDSLAAGHLEDRIVKLVEKLDASDSRLAHLEAIERGLADLLLQVGNSNAAGGAGAGGSPTVDMLRHEMARTQDALDSVQGTLGGVVDRLTTIEQGMGGGPREADPDSMSLKQPIGKVAARLVSDVPAPAPQPAAPPPLQSAPQPEPAPPKQRPVTAARMPINPDLPPDQPLEPGSGPPPLRASAGMRIAAAEGALGAANPAAAASAKSGFIAAARRAAHAAMQEPSPRVPLHADPDDAPQGEEPSTRSKILAQVKKLFITASAIAIIVGSIQIASNIFDVGVGGNSTSKTAQKPDSGAPSLEAKRKLAETASPSITAGVNQPAIKPADPASGNAGANALNAGPSLTNPQLNIAVPETTQSTPDTTGSIPRTTRVAEPKLPIAIGSAKLRNAASAGDAAAAYEIASRLAEGRGVPANVELAAQWYERAANSGLAPAQFRLAGLYEKGIGVRKDLRQARRLYLAAAGKGNAKAMHNLAVLYSEGIDGKPDYGTAMEWFRKAAQRGVPDSQYNLGVLYARGLGIERNLSESCKWFALAAAHGDREAAKKRDEVAARLDAKTVATIQEAVKTFVAEPQPQDAVSVAEPAGGWDGGAPDKPAAKQTKPRTTNAFDVGKR